LEQLYPNQNVSTLTQAPWTDVLGLLGRSGEEIMMRLLLDCGIFSCLDRRKGVYYQISGMSPQREASSLSTGSRC